jgi:hypothetical protein
MSLVPLLEADVSSTLAESVALVLGWIKREEKKVEESGDKAQAKKDGQPKKDEEGKQSEVVDERLAKILKSVDGKQFDVVLEQALFSNLEALHKAASDQGLYCLPFLFVVLLLEVLSLWFFLDFFIFFPVFCVFAVHLFFLLSETEAIFSLAVSVLDRYRDESKASSQYVALARKLAETFANSSKLVAVRVRALIALFDSIPDSVDATLKSSILQQMFTVALKQERPRLPYHLQKLEQWSVVVVCSFSCLFFCAMLSLLLVL